MTLLKHYGSRIWQTVIQGFLSFICSVTPLRRAIALKQALLRLAGVNVRGAIILGKQLLMFNPKQLTLGHRVVIGDQATLACFAPIEIGDDFLSALGLMIHSGTHDPETLQITNKPVRIGNRVWCAMRVTICAGVTIGDDVVIGAGSVVTKSIPSGVVAAGVPCKVIRPLNRNPETKMWSAWDTDL